MKNSTTGFAGSGGCPSAFTHSYMLWRFFKNISKPFGRMGVTVSQSGRVDSDGKARARSHCIKSGQQRTAADREKLYIFYCPLDGNRFKNTRRTVMLYLCTLLNSCTVCRIARSTGIRSMLEAPIKPTAQVLRNTCSKSFALSMAPP